MGLKIEFSWNRISDYLLDLFPFISVKETSFLYQSSLQNEVIFKRQTPAAGVQLSHPLCCLGRPTKDSSLPDIYSCFMVACIVFIGHELFVVRLSLWSELLPIFHWINQNCWKLFRQKIISEKSLLNPVWHDVWKQEMVFCYHNCSNVLWEKNCSSVRKKKWIEKKVCKFEAVRPRLCNVFEVNFFSKHKEHLFSTVS